MATALEVNPTAEIVGRVVTKDLLESSVALKPADIAEKSGRQASSAATIVTGQGETADRTKTLALVTAKRAHHVTATNRLEGLAAVKAASDARTPGRPAGPMAAAAASIAGNSGRLENLELAKAGTIVAANVQPVNLVAVTEKTVAGIGRAVAGRASVKGHEVTAATANAMAAVRTATEKMPVRNSASRHCLRVCDHAISH